MQSGKLVGAMKLFLQSVHRHIKKESLWVLSNLTVGPTEHIDALVQAGILPLVMDLMSSTYDIKKEVCQKVSLCKSSELTKVIMKQSKFVKWFLEIDTIKKEDIFVTSLSLHVHKDWSI